VALFTKRTTPGDCITRIGNAMDEVMAIREMLDATPKGKRYKADWDDNRKYAHAHLSEAWDSLGAALHELGFNQHRPTRDEQAEATVEMQRKYLHALQAEVKCLEGALALVGARAAATEAVAVEHSQPEPQVEELARSVRRIV
jgi:hypothetical protein